MRIKNAIYILAIFLVMWYNNKNGFCTEINTPIEAEELRLFLLKGYTSAKSVLKDVRVEYEKVQIPVNPPPLTPAVLEKLNMKKQPDIDRFRFTHVEEYIQKNSKERWVFLYHGKSTPTEDVSYKADLIGTENSPPFKVVNDQYFLDYYPTKKDGVTKVGRATLDARKTTLFESYGSAPVQFYGYYPGQMPDDVLSSTQLKIQTKPEKIDDLLTYKVSAPIQITNTKTKYNMVYWLAPERSCLPVKIEVEMNGRLASLLEAKEFFELDDGRWAIKSIIQKNLWYREDEQIPTESVNLVYTMRKLELHPEIDEDKIFSTSPDSLPDGVDIIDKISGLRYSVDEGPVSERSLSRILQESIETINDIPNVTETKVDKETVSECTKWMDDANKPLFSDTGILASETTNQDNQITGTKRTVLAITLVGTSILVVSLIAIAAFRKAKQ